LGCLVTGIFNNPGLFTVILTLPLRVGEQPGSLFPDDRPRRLSGEEMSRFEKIYATGRRAIWRWWAKGAPLFEPEKMPAWWQATQVWSLPAKIQRAAEEARSARQPDPPPTGDPPEGKTSAEGDKSEESINLSDYELAEGEGVKLQRQLVKALFVKLHAAYNAGAGIELAQNRYSKAVEALRKLEGSERASQKALGILLPKDVIWSDISAAVELLRHMRESMVRKVLELCPELLPEDRDRVAKAIIYVREQEDRVFRNLKSLKSPEDVAYRLAA